jgi:hypothetical protein
MLHLTHTLNNATLTYYLTRNLDGAHIRFLYSPIKHTPNLHSLSQQTPQRLATLRYSNAENRRVVAINHIATFDLR